jgi:hypothetical protein
MFNGHFFYRRVSFGRTNLSKQPDVRFCRKKKKTKQGSAQAKTQCGGVSKEGFSHQTDQKSRR